MMMMVSIAIHLPENKECKAAQVPGYCNRAMKQHGVMKLVRIPPTHVNPHLSLRHRKQRKMATCSLSSPHEM